jgi:uncharacterized damage-inducible protein DinB
VPGFPEPTESASSPAEVYLRYLDYFRTGVVARIESMPPAEVRASRVPSGWTPIELARHLTFVERRWLQWGFAGRDIGDPWADRGAGDRWQVAADEPVARVLRELQAEGENTRRLVAGHALDEAGAPGPRWDGAPPASLDRILIHLVQEYARHLGQLDVVTELAGGATGE